MYFNLVNYHCQQCDRQRAKRVLGHLAKLGQRAKSRQRSGHKAIRKKLRNLFKLNSIKANLKLKQTTTVGQTIGQGSTSHESKLDIGQ